MKRIKNIFLLFLFKNYESIYTIKVKKGLVLIIYL